MCYVEQAWSRSVALTRDDLTKNEEPSKSAPEAPPIKLEDTTESAILDIREALQAGLRLIHTVLSERLQEPADAQVTLLHQLVSRPASLASFWRQELRRRRGGT